MSLIPEAYNEIQVEEARFRAPTSESMFTRIGAVLNILSRQQRNTYQFEFAGPFRPLSGGEGGVLAFTNKQEVVGFSGRLRTTGASGTTTMDLHYERAGVDQGSVWSAQKLVIPNTVADLAYFWIDLRPTVAVSDKSTGLTLPTFDITDFDQGDILRLDVDGNALGARDLIINVWHRPRP